MTADSFKYLGQNTRYPSCYDASQLERVKRVGLSTAVTCMGVDLWRVYEASFCNKLGVPQSCQLSITVPSSSTYLVESKSLKLYFMSFHQHQLADVSAFLSIVTTDLSNLLSCDVLVTVLDCSKKGVDSIPGVLLESKFFVDQPFSLQVPAATILKPTTTTSTKSYYTQLFQSLCPVTGQPDFATVWVHVKGVQPSVESLLVYLLSYRQHGAFHEQCIEQIFADLYTVLLPTELQVYGCFLRRGGIEINPFRSTHLESKIPFGRLPAQ